MKSARPIRDAFCRLGITTSVLLDHLLLAALMVFALVGSFLWELYGAALVGDIARVVDAWLRRKLRLPPIEESPTQRRLDARKP